MKVTIKETEIELRYSFRALMMYENIQKESFNPKTLSDIIVFFYCIVLSSAPKNITVMFDDFMDWIDANPNILNDFSQWLMETISQQQTLAPQVEKQEQIEDDGKN